MGKFGWSYPPGCTGREPGGPEEDAPEETPMIQELYDFLEGYCVPSDIIEKAIAPVREWELKLIKEQNDELTYDGSFDT